MVFEYLKTMNARNIDRSCVRLHSGSSAHYFISKNRRSSIFRGFVQSHSDFLPVRSFPQLPVALLLWF